MLLLFVLPRLRSRAYDNSIVAYKTAESQTVSLVLDTIRLAVKQEKKKVAGRLQLHSDQGFQYTSQAYFKLTKEYGIAPSMSRRGNCYDNAMAENFFSILKTECIYRQKIKTVQQARACLKNVSMSKRRLFSAILFQFSLKYIQYSCVKLASSGAKLSCRWSHFHFSNGA